MFGRSIKFSSTNKQNRQKQEPSLLKVEGLEVPVVIKRHNRARRLIMRVNERLREVQVTLPDHCEADEARVFVEKNIGWILTRLDKLPIGTEFIEGAEVPLRGVAHRIRFVERNAGREVVTVMNTVTSDGNGFALSVSGGNEHGPRRLQDWLKKQAKEDIVQRVNYHAGRLKLVPTRISVRDQRSRWGSCSSSGALSFSWRLILAPAFVLDYVAAHEVAHLAEMNHGPNFWRLVKKTMPDYENSQAWLKVHGASLHRYG